MQKSLIHQIKLQRDTEGNSISKEQGDNIVNWADESIAEEIVRGEDDITSSEKAIYHVKYKEVLSNNTPNVILDKQCIELIRKLQLKYKKMKTKNYSPCPIYNWRVPKVRGMKISMTKKTSQQINSRNLT